jgi:hypothetical protein
MALPIVNEQGQEFESVEAFNNLLIKGRDAQYLLTPHMFHGGVHLSDESVPWGRDRAPVRCIADGEVVAYRMMKQYLTSEYQGEQLRYSNSFCLVRHRYQETTPEGEKREFRYYSLYMHLRPMEEYPQANRYRLKQPRRVRHSVPSADFQPPTLTLKAGEEFELVEGVARQRGVVEGQGEFEFARIKILTAGGSSAYVLATEGTDILWLAMDEQAIEPAFTVKWPSWIYDQVEAVVTESMVGRADPLDRKGATGYPLAGGGSYSVAKGSLIQFSAHDVEWQEIGGKARQMARCWVVPMAKTVWMCVEAQNIEIKRQGTSTLDKLYALPKPVAIKGGDVIGYLGRYEGPETRFGGRNEEHLVHLEVFSDDPKVETIVGSGRWQEAGYKLVKGDSHGALVKPVPDFFGELYRACDLDKDGELSAEEIWAGLKNKRTADGLFKIVAEHNSEWWAPASKAMLDQFAAVEKEPEEALLRAHEQERVQKLSWMDKPEGRRLGFGGPKVWFFYPMAFEEMKSTKLRKKVNRPENVQKFLDMASEAAMSTASKWGVPASVLLAQSALESGWGLHVKNNAYFGIKGKSPSGNSVSFGTTEVINGKVIHINDTFRAYADFAESADDYGRFLNDNKRYKTAFPYTKQPNKFITEVANAGYATDPNYASKLIHLMGRYDLYEFDE